MNDDTGVIVWTETGHMDWYPAPAICRPIGGALKVYSGGVAVYRPNKWSSFEVTKGEPDRSALQVRWWVNEERTNYVPVKYGEDKTARVSLVDDMFAYPDLGPESQWYTFITNYLSRAQVLGVDTPGGQQAFLKLLVTVLHAAETMILVHGTPPKPGLPSGEVQTW